jgi:O-antigen/teichoic acid export membrane protein
MSARELRVKTDGLRSGATAFLGGQVLNLGLGLLTSVPIARGLGPRGKGDFAFYSWLVTLGVMALAGGWQSAVATTVSQEPARGPAVVAATRRRLLPFLVLLVGLAAALALLGRFEWMFVALACATQIWTQPASGALLGSGRLLAFQVGLFAQSSLMLALVVGLWWGGGALTAQSTIGAFTLALGATLVAHSAAARCGFGWGSAASGPEAPSTLARHAWLANLATFVNYRIDVLVVRHLAGVEALGYYSTATTIAELGRMAPNAVAQASLRPLGLAAGGERARVARGAAGLGLLGSIVTLLPLVFAAPWLVPVLYGPAFAPVAPLVAWLAPGVACLAVASVASAWLNVSGRSRVGAQLAWIGSLVGAGLAVVLVSAAGAVGAALASTLSYAVLAAIVWRRAARG